KTNPNGTPPLAAVPQQTRPPWLLTTANKHPFCCFGCCGGGGGFGGVAVSSGGGARWRGSGSEGGHGGGLWFEDAGERRRLGWSRCGKTVAVAVVTAVVVVAVEEWGWRVRESDIEDRIDREVRKLFGFAGKIPPEKFSDGGSVVAGGG
nr:hypothetical protein [Tanacetum cinerariifolium]